MSYQEKSSVLSIICTSLILVAYGLTVLTKYRAGTLDLSGDLSSWGVLILIFIPIAIVLRIVIEIVSAIVHAAATGQEADTSFADERDRLIDLKGTKISYTVFGIGFLLGLITLTLKWPGYVMLNVFYIAAMLADIVGETAKLRFYRQGV